MKKEGNHRVIRSSIVFRPAFRARQENFRRHPVHLNPPERVDPYVHSDSYVHRTPYVQGDSFAYVDPYYEDIFYYRPRKFWIYYY